MLISVYYIILKSKRISFCRIRVSCVDYLPLFFCHVFVSKDGWENRWVKSEWKKEDKSAGEWSHTSGNWSGDANDKRHMIQGWLTIVMSLKAKKKKNLLSKIYIHIMFKIFLKFNQ